MAERKRGRPLTGAPKIHNLQIRLDEVMYKALQNGAAEMGVWKKQPVHVTDYARFLIQKGLEKRKKNSPF